MRIVNGIKMFNTKELQELLGVSYTTLAKLRRSGQLRSARLGKSLYTSEQSLTDYLNGVTKPQPKTEIVGE